jgi:hypothetical protein
VLWIRIPSDRLNFGGSGSVSISQPHVKLNYTILLYSRVPGTFHDTVKNIENYDIYEPNEKDKTLFTALL